MPVAHAKAAEIAGLNAALSVLCLTGDQGSDKNDNGTDNSHPHNLGCCLPGGRFLLDAPALVASGIVVFLAPVLIQQNVKYILPEGRAPPAITATPSQSRAPPIPA